MITDGQSLNLYHFAEPYFLALGIPPEFDVPNRRHRVEDGRDQHCVALLDDILRRVSSYSGALVAPIGFSRRGLRMGNRGNFRQLFQLKGR
jgi:hypothetical protein